MEAEADYDLGLSVIRPSHNRGRFPFYEMTSVQEGRVGKTDAGLPAVWLAIFGAEGHPALRDGR